MYLNKQNIFVIILCFLIIHPGNINASWFDDLTDTISNGLNTAADYIKQTAAPTIKNKTEELKTTLQDPDTYKGFKEWLNQVAIPTLKEKASAAGEYMKTEVLPELKKVYEAIKHNDTEGVSNN
uniref:SXP/RAL-2 family protein Ani s 5-like cation-binding domain-containing protein n=1 Tax=Strongyloides stercoralis TaxID=6248 RepID=A0AAF5DL70_STRER